MYKCKPERKTKPVYAIAVISVAVSSVLLYFGNERLLMPGVMQLAALLLMVFGLYAVIRFGMSEIIYTVTDEHFSITKVTGKKTQELGQLDLETAIDVCDESTYKEKYQKKVNMRLDHRQNIFGTSHYYICEFNGKYASIRFEPNEEFVSIMRDKIAAAISRRNQRPQSEEDRMFY